MGIVDGNERIKLERALDSFLLMRSTALPFLERTEEEINDVIAQQLLNIQNNGRVDINIPITNGVADLVRI